MELASCVPDVTLLHHSYDCSWSPHLFRDSCVATHFMCRLLRSVSTGAATADSSLAKPLTILQRRGNVISALTTYLCTPMSSPFFSVGNCSVPFFSFQGLLRESPTSSDTRFLTSSGRALASAHDDVQSVVRLGVLRYLYDDARPTGRGNDWFPVRSI